MDGAKMQYLRGSWRVSSYSGGQAHTCVEVAPVEGGAVVRDSKRRTGPVVAVAARSWTTLTRALKSA